MRSLSSAIHDKYISEEDEDIHSENWVIFVPKTNIRNKDCEKIILPTRLTLDNEKISTVGDVEVIDDLCQHVTELDLSKNRISDWKQVFTILNHMPQVHFLNLMGNPLDKTTLNGQDDEYKFNITDLVLNNTNVCWSTLARVLPLFPRLKELHISLNGYNTINISIDKVLSEGLEKLYMNESSLKDWSDISKLGHVFPSLQHLTIIQTPITKFTDTPEYKEFPKLISLNISGCCLCTWDEIDKLNRFPCLESLRMTDIPFFENFEKKMRRQHAVARLPNIIRLNGTDLTETEREDAERAFIRFYMDADEPMIPDIYYELEKKHGKVDHLAHVDLAPREYVTRKVTFEDRSEFLDIKLEQTVSEFRKFLQTFTGLHFSKTNVYFEQVYNGVLLNSSLMKLPNKKLLSYYIRDEDRFLIELKDNPRSNVGYIQINGEKTSM